MSPQCGAVFFRLWRYAAAPFRAGRFTRSAGGAAGGPVTEARTSDTGNRSDPPPGTGRPTCAGLCARAGAHAASRRRPSPRGAGGAEGPGAAIVLRLRARARGACVSRPCGPIDVVYWNTPGAGASPAESPCHSPYTRSAGRRDGRRPLMKGSRAQLMTHEPCDTQAWNTGERILTYHYMYVVPGRDGCARTWDPLCAAATQPSLKEIEGDRGQRKLAAEPKWKVDTPQGNIVRTPREKEKGLGRRGGN